MAGQCAEQPEQLYRRCVAEGVVSYVPVKSGSSLAGFIKDRFGETNTHFGLLGGAFVSPVVVQGIQNSIPALLAGDYAAAAQCLIPALLGVAGTLGAVLTPEKTK